MLFFGMLGSKKSLDQRADPVKQGQNEGFCPIGQYLDVRQKSYAKISVKVKS